MVTEMWTQSQTLPKESSPLFFDMEKIKTTRREFSEHLFSKAPNKTSNSPVIGVEIQHDDATFEVVIGKFLMQMH